MRTQDLALSVLALALGCNSSGGIANGDAGAHDSATDAPSKPRDGEAEGAPPIRTATTRSLLPTSVQSLLIDPFLTGDTSWGHFRAIVPPSSGGSPTECGDLVRELLSQSPAGVSGPAVRATASAGSPSAGCTQILAPFSGVTTTANADMWVSLSDASGAPLPFPADAHALAAALEIAILPNYLPSDSPQVTYALESTGAPMVIAGREWGRVALAAPAPLTKGGWFSITLVDASGSFYFSAPEVVPTDLVTLVRPHARPMTDADRSAISEYERVVRSGVRKRPSPGR
jgi:hypothetical protein